MNAVGVRGIVIARSLAASLLAAALLLGCDSKDASPQPSAAPSTPTSAPATQTADLVAPTTQPSELLINGKAYSFPPAKLRVGKADGHVIARLYTNDPKAALADDYHGNGYDLLMQLDDIDSPAQVYSAVWDFKAASHDSPTTPYGIFLDGLRFQLVPSQVTAHFIGDSLMVRVDVQGQFIQQNQADPNDPAKVVNVTGRLLAPVEYKD